LSKKRNFVFKIIQKVLYKIQKPFFICRKDDVVRLNLHDFALPSSLASDCLIDLVRLEAEELTVIAAYFGGERAAKIHERLTTSQCFVLYNNSKIAGWIWATKLLRPREGDGEFFYAVAPLPGHIYLYDGYILPHERGNGLGYKLIACVCMHLADQGHDFVFFTHDHRNRAMQSITQRLGFERIGELKYMRILWHKTIDIKVLETVCQSFEKM
jgi:GNAT superfamily N-acetyltransferase